ncbi:MAG: hypothetical protein AAFQ07_01310, partial [Chloroflexota bacterium]
RAIFTGIRKKLNVRTISLSPVLNFLLGYLIFNQVAVNTIGALIPMKLGPVTTDGMIIWQNWRKL